MTPPEVPHQELLDRVFFALSDPVRRAILERLGGERLPVSEVAAPFPISLQAVSRHVHVLAHAGLVRQERTGRVVRCGLEVGPIFAAATWINEYRRFWEAQLDALGGWLKKLPREGRIDGRPARRKGARWARASRRRH